MATNPRDWLASFCTKAQHAHNLTFRLDDTDGEYIAVHVLDDRLELNVQFTNHGYDLWLRLFKSRRDVLPEKEVAIARGIISAEMTALAARAFLDEFSTITDKMMLFDPDQDLEPVDVEMTWSHSPTAPNTERQTFTYTREDDHTLVSFGLPDSDGPMYLAGVEVNRTGIQLGYWTEDGEWLVVHTVDLTVHQ